MSSTPRPDLAYPAVPDVQELRTSARPVEKGGMSLRENEDGFTWPEAGPSRQRVPSDQNGIARAPLDVDGKQPLVSPFGAKFIAAITGASTTALLMTPFDVLKTRMQTVQPHPNYLDMLSKPTLSSVSAEECCQTSILNEAPRSGGKQLQPSLESMTCFTSASSSTPSSSGTLSLQVPTNRTSFASSLKAPEIPPAPAGCLYPSKWAGIWGETFTLSTALSSSRTLGESNGASTLVLPTAATGESVLGGFWQEIAAVRREAGVRGLWKGVGTTLAMGMPSAAIYMLGYEKLVSIISPHFTGSTDPSVNASSLNRSASSTSIGNSLTPAPLLAGSLARTISATVISPIEMFRTRLQALPNERGSPTYASTAKEMSNLVKNKGFTVLWRGLGPTLWRDVPFSGAYWAGFEILKTYFNSSQSVHMSPVAISFCSGAISGTFSALITQPFDVLKTRRQVFTPSPDCSPSALHHKASTIPLAIHVVKTEGWGALFAGTIPRCGKVAPACGLMIACYEGVGRYLGEAKTSN